MCVRGRGSRGRGETWKAVWEARAHAHIMTAMCCRKCFNRYGCASTVKRFRTRDEAETRACCDWVLRRA
eukprot:1920313-Pleurochrysis_carterae.AAC.1